MLALVAIFVVTVVASATAVWLYRKATNLHGFTANLVGRSKAKGNSRMGLQKGFTSLGTTPGKTKKNIRLRKSTGDIKAPWGW